MVLRVFLLVGFLSLPAFATETISPGLVKLVHQLYLAQGREVSTAQTKQQLLQNQFLLSQAKQLNPELLLRQSSVGFSTAYHVDKYLYHALQQWFPALQQTSWQMRPLLIDQAQLLATLGAYPSSGQYTAAQLNRWQAIQLVKQSELTLAQVLDSQSMQNRYQLHQGDVKLLRSIVNQQLKQQRTFAAAKPLLARQQLSLEQVRQVVTAELIRPSMLAYLGVKEELHGATSKYVAQLQSSIPATAIGHYYQQHRAQFRYVKQVHASAAQFSQRQAAVEFRQAVQASSWQDAVKQLQPSLVWQAQLMPINRDSQPRWQAQLAFTLEPGTISPVIRTPAAKWLVLTTQSPVTDYYSVDSETVRYQAMQTLTRQVAQQRFNDKYDAWLKQRKEQL